MCSTCAPPRKRTRMLRLRDQLYHCRSGNRTIFLDVDADRYFCLPDKLEPMFRNFQVNGAHDSDGEFVVLVERGILVSAPPSGKRIESMAPPRPTLNAPTSIGSGWNLALTSLAVAHHLLVRHKLRRRRFSAILNVLAARSQMARLMSAGYASPKQTARIVSAFDRAGIILGVTDQCLVRSMSMLAMMHNIGAAPYLVFGVRTNPFSAHCWIQEGDIVLNDSPEHARLFEPILAI